MSSLDSTPSASAEPRSESSLTGHLCKAFRRAVVETTPFAHIYLDRAFPDEVYREMLDLVPERSVFRPLSETKYRLPDGTSTRDLLQLEPEYLQGLAEPTRALWEEVSTALRSDALKAAVYDCLAAPLARRYRIDPRAIHEIVSFPRPALVVDRGGYEITPHPDTSSKIITLQFYLPADDSQLDYGTSLYRRRIFKLENLSNPSKRFEQVKRLPFRPNSAYGFVVTRSSWHGRERLPMDGKPRLTLLNIYYSDPNKAY